MKHITKCLFVAVPFVLAASTVGAETFVRMLSGPW